jgi:hypothetical protein
LQDFQFTVGEAMDVTVIEVLLSVSIPSVQCLDGLTDNLGIKIEFPTNDCFDGLLETPHRVHLVEIPKGAGPDASLRIELLAVVGIDEDLQIGIEGLQMLDKLEAIFPVKLDLQHHEIDGILLHFFNGLFGSGTGPDDIPMTQLLDIVG